MENKKGQNIQKKKARFRLKVKASRALNLVLTPKAARFYDKRPYPPGMHGRTRRKGESDYSVRLKEKQRLKAQYGIREKQLNRIFKTAKQSSGITGDNLLIYLETRLDSLVLRSGLTTTISHARQLVVHGHILVDNYKVDRPSYKVLKNQTISIRKKSLKIPCLQVAMTGEYLNSYNALPNYLDIKIEKLQSTLIRLPDRSEIPTICNEKLVVEFYSR